MATSGELHVLISWFDVIGRIEDNTASFRLSISEDQVPALSQWSLRWGDMPISPTGKSGSMMMMVLIPILIGQQKMPMAGKLKEGPMITSGDETNCRVVSDSIETTKCCDQPLSVLMIPVDGLSIGVPSNGVSNIDRIKSQRLHNTATMMSGM